MTSDTCVSACETLTYRHRKRREEERRRFELLRRIEQDVPRWKKVETRVRRRLGFKDDKACRQLGIDGARVDQTYYNSDGAAVSRDAIAFELDSVQAGHVHDDFFFDPFIEFLKKRTSISFSDDAIQLALDEDLSSTWDLYKWLQGLIRTDSGDYEPGYRIETAVSFLEVKDRPTVEAGPSDIDTFVGKMMRGGAQLGLFVASYYKRSVLGVVRDHNKELAKIGKQLRFIRLKWQQIESLQFYLEELHITPDNRVVWREPTKIGTHLDIMS